MVDLIGFIIWVGEQFFEFGYVLPGLAEVERTKILIEIVVEEILDMEGGTLSMLK
jgi:hypothetical protein